MDFQELDAAFGHLLERIPEKRRTLVESAGEKMYQEVVKNIDRDTKEKTGNLKKGVTKVIGSGGGYAAVRNNYLRSPHAHLVENGHRIVKNGKTVGWVAGKHMYRNALTTLEKELIGMAQKEADYLAGEFK